MACYKIVDRSPRFLPELLDAEDQRGQGRIHFMIIETIHHGPIY